MPFNATVTFESDKGEPVCVRSAIDDSDADRAAQRAVLRALPAVGRTKWESVVIVLTRVALLLLLLPSAVSAQDPLGCPAGTPRAFWPGPYFVPDSTCQGWVPRDHPLAKRGSQVAPTQDILTQIEHPRSTGAPITALSGWALDCKLGTFPPVFRLLETKPDGSVREIPNSAHWNVGEARPDVHLAQRLACPAVLNVPLADGTGGGYNDRFGWSLLVAPITEPGVHTFTVLFAWPAQNHAGSSTISVVVR